MRTGLFAATACALVIVAEVPAAANGRYSASNQIAFSPSDASFIVLRTTYGLVLSRDGGESWQWLCEDALGIVSSSQDPLLGMAASTVVATPGLSSGVLLSRDQGCDWTPIAGPLAGQLVKDLAVRPDAPDTVLALTSTYGLHAGADGGVGYVQQVFESTDDGASWAPDGVAIDPSALATTLDVAAADDQRIYVSAVRENGQVASLFVSDDRGADWTELPVPIDPTHEFAIYIAAIDPADPDLIYVRTQGTSSARLLVSHDAGRTFTVPLSLGGPMLGFALSADGSKIYAGDMTDGLFVGSRDTLSFKKVSSIHVQCLGTQGASLWACSDDLSGFVAGVSTDDGADFTAKLHLVAPSLLSCAADSGASTQCSGTPRQSLCLSLPGCETADASAGPPEPAMPSPSSSCGCDLVGRGSLGEAWAAAMVCGVIALALRAVRTGRAPRGGGRRGRR